MSAAELTCSFCGSTVAATAPFCLQCGERNPSRPEAPPRTAKSSGGRVGIVVGAVVIGIGLIAFAYWQFVMPPEPTVTTSVTTTAPSVSAPPVPQPPAAPAPVVEPTSKPPVAEPASPAPERAARKPMRAPVPDVSSKPAIATVPEPAKPVPEPAKPAPEASKPAPADDRSNVPPSESRPAPAAQAAPQVRAAPADRWDEMAREIAACDEKNAVAAAFCVDRTRRKYCTDYWDKVPQCRVTGIKP
jgi:hypothetical protein